MFRNKEYILAVYQEGGFTKAAERLFVSQPSLSASIKRIEDKLGAPIFDRSTSPISLTEIGKEYVKYALSIQEKEKDFSRYISDHTNLMAGKIRIGGSSFFSSFVLPRLVSEFNESHPQIQFEIFEDSTKNLMNKLVSGNLDIIIDNAINENENIISEVYAPETLLLAVPKALKSNQSVLEFAMTAQDIKENKHLDENMSVKLSAFKDERFILLNPENDTGKRAEKLFKKYGISPSVIFHLDQQVTAFNMACLGLGITFVSDTLIKYDDSERDMYYYRLFDIGTNRNIYFYRKKNHYQSVASRKFIEYNTK
ncbi:MAG: LysR family transcriptional regulator [Clostridiales bacterium]|nr:LysR family transcriptional regulator [Clostridiales bacterium]